MNDLPDDASPLTDDADVMSDTVQAPDAPQPVSSQLVVDLGEALPAVPPLKAEAPATSAVLPSHPRAQASGAETVLADGLRFDGNAVLRGPCSVGCRVLGNLAAAEGCAVSVVVTQTGQVEGDITAEKISVMGQTNGVLDAGLGEVLLFETASVQGLVRYGRIQVNGADLNATLERARP